MNGKKTTQENETGNTESSSDEGNKYETTPLIDIANAAAERMEKANQETERLLDRQEELMMKRALGGRSAAGTAPKKPKISDEEYVNAAIANQLPDES